MNRNIALSLVLCAAGAVQADDITPEPPFTSTLTRAEVIADMQQFRRSGIDPWALDYNPLAAFRGDRMSAQLRDEYIADRARVAALHGEDSGSMSMARRDVPQGQQQTQVAAVPGDDLQQ